MWQGINHKTGEAVTRPRDRRKDVEAELNDAHFDGKLVVGDHYIIAKVWMTPATKPRTMEPVNADAD